MGEITKQTFTSVKWTALESIILKVIQFALGIILARLLIPADYGLLGMIGIFIAVASTFVDSGMGNALLRKKEPTEADYSTVFLFNIGASIILYILLFISSPWIAQFFNEPSLTAIVRVVSLNLIIGSLASTQNVKFVKNLDFKVLAKISITSSIISGLTGIVLAYNGWGVWALVFQTLSAGFLNMMLKWIFSKWKPSLAFSKTSFKELFGYGSKILGANILNTVYDQSTTFLIGKFYSPSQLGYYTRGYSFPCMLRDFILGPVERVTLPILSKIQDETERLLIVYRKYIKLFGVVIIFAMVLLAAMAKPLVFLLLTEKWAPAIPFMQIFCFCYMLDYVCRLNLNLLMVKGRSDLFLKLEIIKKSLSMAMLLAAVPFGVMAICIMKLIYSQLAVMINCYYTGKLFKIGYLSQLKDFFPYLIYSVFACLPIYLLTFTIIPLWLIITVGLLMAMCFYVIILKWVKDDCYEEYIKPALCKLWKLRLNFSGTIFTNR